MLFLDTVEGVNKWFDCKGVAFGLLLLLWDLGGVCGVIKIEGESLEDIVRLLAAGFGIDYNEDVRCLLNVLE